MPRKGKKLGGDMARLMSKLVPNENGCLDFQGALYSNGYGAFGYPIKTMQAHRAMWMMVKGEIPAGYHVDHLCRNRRCCNIEHLEAVPARVNCFERARNHYSKVMTSRTHCKHGHEYTPENTIRREYARGRICRECSRAAARIHSRNYQRKKKLALWRYEQNAKIQDP